jgi:hypothetical protein
MLNGTTKISLSLYFGGEEALHIPFGGKVVVFGGDPKQILPVIENGTKEQIINACITNSYLWKNIDILLLTENMRLKKQNMTSDEYEKLLQFNNWILSVGDGQHSSSDIVSNNTNKNDCDSIIIKIPKDLLIETTGDKIRALVDSTYPEFQVRYGSPEYIKERAILATTNDIVDQINDYIISLLPTPEREYYSADSISKCTDMPNDANILYPIEYLNTLNPNNFPQHKLKLKTGTRHAFKKFKPESRTMQWHKNYDNSIRRHNYRGYNNNRYTYWTENIYTSCKFNN